MGSAAGLVPVLVLVPVSVPVSGLVPVPVASWRPRLHRRSGRPAPPERSISTARKYKYFVFVREILWLSILEQPNAKREG